MAGDGNTVAVSLKLTGEDLEGISNSVSFTSRGSFLEACRDRKIGNSVAQKEANKLPERDPVTDLAVTHDQSNLPTGRFRSYAGSFLSSSSLTSGTSM